MTEARPPRTVEEAWAVIRGAPASLAEAGLVLREDGGVRVRGAAGAPAAGGDAADSATDSIPAEARALLEIFLPLQARARWVVGQLGQSLDGRIATASGHSHYINGPEDIRRLHGLRALADAVVVGAGTAASDDPRLTARELPGPDPVRVVLDPRGRLLPGLNVFSDGGPETLWIRGTAGGASSIEAGPGPNVHVLRLPVAGGAFDPAAVLDLLRSRGLERILVEGGGRTVSSFLEAGLLDRLHICVAPLLIGSGRPGITLPEVETLDEALRPPCRQLPLGRDVLFDLDLSGEG